MKQVRIVDGKTVTLEEKVMRQRMDEIDALRQHSANTEHAKNAVQQQHYDEFAFNVWWQDFIINNLTQYSGDLEPLREVAHAAFIAGGDPRSHTT